MATYQVMYWQEIPAQVRAEDDEDEVKLELDSRFQVYIDQVATQRGVTGTDEYLDCWKWGDEQERDGSAREVAEAVKKELEASFKLE